MGCSLYEFLLKDLLSCDDFEGQLSFKNLSRKSFTRCSKMIHSYRCSHRRRSVKLQVQAFGPATLLKRNSNTGIFLWNLLKFQNNYFEEHLRTTSSVATNNNDRRQSTFKSTNVTFFDRKLTLNLSSCIVLLVIKYSSFCQESECKSRTRERVS